MTWLEWVAALLSRFEDRGPSAVRLAGLSEPVEVSYDRRGIPHIAASSLRDAFMAQGYCHARDRLWQMDLTRRVASGWLSEAFGSQALPVDRFMRRIGLRRCAEAEWRWIDEPERELLRAYAEGVNAAAARPVEMRLLGLRWRPWEPVDSLVWVRAMALDLSGNWQVELLRAELALKVGPELAAKLALPHPAGQPITVGGTTVDALERLTREFREVMPLMGGGGSNCWAV
ncbi:MAG: penicillin acylase family protein, partial [Candidatus Eremiobacterota bacterium]